MEKKHDDNENQEHSQSPCQTVVGNNIDWKLIGHSYQIADTGDYDGHYEITDGKISLLTNHDDNEALQPIVDALNNSGCKFYQDDSFEFENKVLKEEISRLKFMIDNGLGWEDMENDISPMHGFWYW